MSAAAFHDELDRANAERIRRLTDEGHISLEQAAAVLAWWAPRRAEQRAVSLALDEHAAHRLAGGADH